jgi:hypothetical protein
MSKNQNCILPIVHMPCAPAMGGGLIAWVGGGCGMGGMARAAAGKANLIVRHKKQKKKILDKRKKNVE